MLLSASGYKKCESHVFQDTVQLTVKGQMKMLSGVWVGGGMGAWASTAAVGAWVSTAAVGAGGAPPLVVGSPARVCPWRDLRARALRVGSRPVGSCGTPTNMPIAGAAAIDPLAVVTAGSVW